MKNFIRTKLYISSCHVISIFHVASRISVSEEADNEQNQTQELRLTTLGKMLMSTLGSIPYRTRNLKIKSSLRLVSIKSSV